MYHSLSHITSAAHVCLTFIRYTSVLLVLYTVYIAKLANVECVLESVQVIVFLFLFPWERILHYMLDTINSVFSPSVLIE